jgi:hypothetical protein
MQRSRSNVIESGTTPLATEESVARSTATSAADIPPADDGVARSAYERFERRGGEHGHDLDDWLEAERELGAKTK